MNERIRVLKADLISVKNTIETIYRALDNYRSIQWDEERTIVIGYYLHNLYSAFENVFQLIAETFENQVPDRSQWHAQLLRRMAMDIEGVRPSFLSAESHDCLDELMRFRHVFRSAYGVGLDAQRLKLVWEKAQRLRTTLDSDFKEFFTFLDSLE